MSKPTPPLAEIVALIKRAQAGDLEARNAAVEANIGLVKTIAQQRKRPGVGFEDCCQNGYLALTAAIKNFDTTRPEAWGAYAHASISGAMRNGVAYWETGKRCHGAFYPIMKSLDAPITEDSEMTILDRMVSDDDLEANVRATEARALIRAHVQRLPPRARWVLQRRYCSDSHVSLEELARELRVSHQSVGQAEKKGIALMKRRIRKQLAKEMAI